MNRHRLPVWALVIIDLAAAAVCVGLVLLVLYIIPQGSVVENSAADEEAVTQFALPSEGSGVDLGIAAASQNDWSHADTLSLAADQEEIKAFLAAEKTRETLQEYAGSTSEISIEKVSCTVDGEPVVYFVADVYVSATSVVQTAFAKNMYGRNIRDFVSSMARDNQAILAISGDSYGESDSTCVIRNGVVYNSNPGTSDVCVLFQDGVMKTYSALEFDAEAVQAQGAWQAWTFGPALLDGNGNIPDAFHSTEYLNKINPRAAIGYIAPGHYKFVVVDGRQDGYSAGVTMNQLAALMQEEGCMTAYNLDGGKSAVMVYDGEEISKPVGAGRTISDIIYIGAEE
ncbi:MAG: phosphodiester glycosidase family protein [Clostridia bacterium]|nr:phosphodiester glycosidase family protein [Clostridia bacterium]